MFLKNSELPYGKNIKSDLIPSIIHDLKTPLNSVVCFADLIKEEVEVGNLSKEQLLDYIAEIRSSASYMNDLVHDLLDVSCSKGFSVDLNKDVVVDDFIKRSVKVNYSYGLRRKIEIETDIASDVGVVRLDAKRMKQIISNLLSNSIKYSPENTKIKIVCRNLAPHPMMFDRRPNPEFLEITIIDQGFGMNAEQVKMAFEKYQTIENPNSGNVDSFGLGLSIVKQLVEAQKGTIIIESEPNKGTIVKMKFPYLM